MKSKQSHKPCSSFVASICLMMRCRGERGGRTAGCTWGRWARVTCSSGHTINSIFIFYANSHRKEGELVDFQMELTVMWLLTLSPYCAISRYVKRHKLPSIPLWTDTLGHDNDSSVSVNYKEVNEILGCYHHVFQDPVTQIMFWFYIRMCTRIIISELKIFTKSDSVSPEQHKC